MIRVMLFDNYLYSNTYNYLFVSYQLYEIVFCFIATFLLSLLESSIQRVYVSGYAKRVLPFINASAYYLIEALYYGAVI